MIAIRNVYYLLLYAWDALEQGDAAAISAEPETDVLNLLAAVLNRGIDRLLRQGLNRSYVPRQETIAGVRGMLDVSATVKADLLRRAQTVCVFDELTHDVVHNQILKSSVRNLLRADGLDARVQNSLRATWHRLHEVSEIHISDRAFRGVQFHRNNREYRFLVDVCRLLHDYLIPSERKGRFAFRNFLRDKRQMRVLFERFIRNFYRRHAEEYDAESESMQWADTTGSAHDLALLPRMRTDVTLRRPGVVLVVDAKYYLETLQEFRGHATVRSAHLYQLFAYLKNVRNKTPDHADVEGLLLYPLTARAIDLDLRVHGCRIRLNTLNLNQHWSRIHADLIALLPGREPRK